MLYWLFVLFVTSAECTCSDGYEDIGSGLCYKTFGIPKFRSDAEAYCERQGGYLVQPQNAFVNALIQNEAQTLNVLVWLGLTCSGNTTTSCTYSDGNRVTNTSFTNFYPGYPNPIFGSCIYLSTSGSLSGKWISGKCDEQSLAYGCQRNTSAVENCGSSYYEFNNYCYKILMPTPELTAESACRVECGHLTSIHSSQENEFVRDLASRSGQVYARIGLEYKGHLDYEWTDGSVPAQQDYNNFGYTETSLGNCVAMALRDDVIKVGEWINTACINNLTSICKRPKKTPCIPSTILPSLAPPTCSSTYFFEGNGTIYSPGWPSYYTSGLSCEYVITAPPGFIVEVALTSTSSFSDSASTISLYNSITDTTPFLPRLVYGLGAGNTLYSSNESTMKIKFSSGSSNYKWSVSYNAVDIRPSGCNRVLQTPGNITSPNYPAKYPSTYNCKYLLEAPFGKRVHFQYHYFNTYLPDEAFIYDGKDSNSPIITGWAGNDNDILHCNYTSTSYQMSVYFSTDEKYSQQGFMGSFTAV